MLFSSIPFLYYFLPVVIGAYFLAPKRLKNSVLLLASIVFYAWGEPRYAVVMLASVAVGYAAGLLIERFADNIKLRKTVLFTAVAIHVLVLGFFKYTDFFIENFNAVTGLSLRTLRIVLPIGISFYTFQIISYLVDVYRGEQAQKNPINLATYIALFPQLVAGPIVRYSNIAPQLSDRSHSIEKSSDGIKRFLIGLSKKVLLANVLGELCSGFKASEDRSVAFFWLYAIAYTLHVYFDFSGYSDMAIGLGKLFGFEFPENFNYPYISRSITEFWRRWHISLGTWFRDYVYIPLGGNRVAKYRHIINILIVWLLTGFWHGAAWTFILWGLYFAILLIFEKYFFGKTLQRSGILSHIYVLFFVILSFTLFDADSPAMALKTIGALFGAGGYPGFSVETAYFLRSFAVVLVVSTIGATPVPKKLFARMKRRFPIFMTVVEPIGLCTLLVLCTACLVDGSFNPFLYFRF